MTDATLTLEVYGSDYHDPQGLAAANAAAANAPTRRHGETFEDPLAYIRAECAAANLSRCCTAAYWGSAFAARVHHHREAIKSLRAVADVFGFDLVERNK